LTGHSTIGISLSDAPVGVRAHEKVPDRGDAFTMSCPSLKSNLPNAAIVSDDRKQPLQARRFVVAFVGVMSLIGNAGTALAFQEMIVPQPAEVSGQPFSVYPQSTHNHSVGNADGYAANNDDVSPDQAVYGNEAGNQYPQQTDPGQPYPEQSFIAPGQVTESYVRNSPPVIQNSAPFQAAQPFWFGYSSPVRVNVYGGENFAEPGAFASLDILKPIRNWRFQGGSEQIAYVDARVGINFESGGLLNLGLGRRHYFAGRNAIFDANIWYDLDGTRDRLFHQVAAGAQVQGERLLLRGNYYLPFADTQMSAGHTPLTGNVGYQGNILALERFRKEQQAYQGYDVEVGWTLPTPKFARILAGYYKFYADEAEEIKGLSATATAEVIPSLLLSVQGNFGEDDNNNLLFTATYDLYQRRSSVDGSIRHRMAEPVGRTHHIVSRETLIYDPIAATNASGANINIVHVSSAGNSTGAFESPYANLSQAATDAAATPNSIILVHADSVLDGQSISVPQQTRLLSELGTHVVTTTELGDVNLPRATAGTLAPVIRNSPGTAPAITLADNVEVNGLSIENAGGAAIFGQGLMSGTTIRNMSVDGAATGLHLRGTSGTVGVDTLSVANTTGSGILLEVAANGSNVTFSNAVDISNAGLHGVAMTGNSSSSSVTFSGPLTVAQTGGNGIHFESNGDVSAATFNGVTTISDTTGNGVYLSNPDTFVSPSTPSIQFNAALAINRPGQTGFAVANNDSNVQIQTLTVTDWGRSALSIDDTTGKFTIIDPLVLNNTTGSLDPTIDIRNSTESMTFGDVTIVDTVRTAAGAPVVNLIHNDTGLESITFNSLNITSTNGIGLYGLDSAVGDSKLNIGAGTISSVGGAAVHLDGLATNITLQSVSAANTADGLVLRQLGQSTAFHVNFRVVGDGTTPGSGGTMTNVQRGAVIAASEDVSLNLMNIDSSVAGVAVSAVGSGQPENLQLQQLVLTDAGGSAGWTGIDIAWGSGPHFDDPNLITGNTITGTGANQTGINVLNNASLPGLDLTIGGNSINLTGATPTGIRLTGIGFQPSQVTPSGDINLVPSLNNIINASTSPFVTSMSNGAELTGQTRVNGALVP